MIFTDGDPGPEIRRKLNEMVSTWEDALISAVGPQGWSPSLAVVADGARSVLQVIDWVGGEGAKPTITGYIGATGIVATAALAVDIRGSIGATGPSNTLAIGTVTSAASPSATITGASPSQTLNLILPKGDKGDTGNTGPANTLTIGTVTTGAADATITGTAPAQVLNLVLPQGIQGLQGIQGPMGDTGPVGPANTLTIGTVSSGASPSATITGTAPNQVLNLVLEKGDTGAAGLDGSAATITVGTVTTGAPGTQVIINNSGTTSAAILDFTIPKGDSGTGSGDVIGPPSSVNAEVVLFDGTTGKTIKGGGTLATVASSGSYNDLINKPSFILPSEKGAADGVATLDATGKVPAGQLPSYVDDVLEFSSLATFPVTGETGKIYVSLDTNKTYRWSGSVYIQITSGAVDSVAGKTGVVILEKSDVGLGSVDNTADVDKPVSTATQTALNTKQPLDADLTAIAALAGTTGLLKKTAEDTWTLDTATYGDVTLTGAQTLTNKTLTSPIFNDGYTEEVFAVTGTAPALSPTNGSIQTWTLTGNSTPTAGTWASGQSMTLMVDDGSAYTINWASMSITWKTGGGTAPTLLTTGYTVIELAKIGTTIYGWLAGDA